MKKNYLLALIVTLIFASCSKEEDPIVSSGSEQNQSEVLNKKSSYKEIEGKLTYNATTAFDLSCYSCNGSDRSGNFYGTGNLEHLGKISSKTKACVSLIFGQNGPIGVHVYNQCCTFTAPNGDDLTLTTDGYDLYFNQSGVAVGTCKFEFAGGTGKYKKSSGSFKGKVLNYGTYFTVDLEGKLSY